jgi:hypothetical protein
LDEIWYELDWCESICYDSFLSVQLHLHQGRLLLSNSSRTCSNRLDTFHVWFSIYDHILSYYYSIDKFKFVFDAKNLQIFDISALHYPLFHRERHFQFTGQLYSISHAFISWRFIVSDHILGKISRYNVKLPARGKLCSQSAHLRSPDGRYDQECSPVEFIDHSNLSMKSSSYFEDDNESFLFC